MPAERDLAARMLETENLPAIEWLQTALDSNRSLIRWEVVKIMSDSSDPGFLPLLCHAVFDEIDSIAWLAANALIKFGEVAVVEMLNILTTMPAHRLPKNLATFVLAKANLIYPRETIHLITALEAGAPTVVLDAANRLQELLLADRQINSQK